MYKKLLFVYFLFLSSVVVGQDFQYGTFTYEDMNMKSYKNDTSAHAVVLNEYGYAWISDADDVPVMFEHHVKIKIFDNTGFKHGNIEIALYTDEDNETLESISGITYYKDEQGNIKQAELDRKNVFTTKQNKYWSTVKFAMPNLRPGCVIEYKYQTKSKLLRQFHNWEFQADIPKIYTEFRARIPAVYNYNISLRGGRKLLDGPEYKSKLERDCFSFHGIKCDCSAFRFAMKDVPAFVEEDYMTSRNNYLSAIYFELTDYYNLGTGANIKVAKEWKDVDYDLKRSEYFGNQIKKKDIFKEKLVPVLAGKTNQLDKAKAVYAYIQKNIKWNNFRGWGSDDGIRKAFEKHSGSVADINIGLTAALNSAGIDADAVLISTRKNGIVNKLFPVVTEFNYVIVKANIDGKSYLLDATDPVLAFGILPMDCLNDQGRVMSLNKPSEWVDITQPNQATTIAYDFTLLDNGKLKGTITQFSFGYSAYKKRKAIKEFNTKEEFVEDFDEKRPKLKVLKADIKNLDSLDNPLAEIYEVEVDTYDNLNGNKFMFSPFMFNHITQNPFKLEERSYPVDWGMASSDRVTLKVQLPEKFSIENPPKDINIGLPNNGGRFITSFTKDNNMFTFSHAINFTKAIYAPEEYPYLKELYNQIILSEKVDLVFKKN
jgi:hypothetical protein